ncbi:MAG: carboxypeptidase-like regulatory domain-containing protein, partial [Crocinitomicaceae bacterium]|nr:carboxypeptidase-like regulatory domain-containing protein [Crocinitomicaceae bacterium]
MLIVLTVNSSFAQSLSQLEKKATESFNKKDYASALIDFRQLLAQNPTSMDFNFKYGVCVFYSDNRKNAKRYFDFVLRQRDFPSETYYFVAKLSHFEYKFSSAMLYYQKYLDNTPEKLRDHDVKMELDQCANGKTLLKSPKALRLINAVEVAIPKFYMNYQLESRTGGFFTDEALQSKMDKKFNHLPMYYFLRGDSLKFFASYGTSTNKDIYFVRKIGADAWSPAIKINDQVNSLLDEDFPFYDQKNGTLYFSSRGHNSIGGYDLFKATFDPSRNNADNRSNFDFPYSSADDDFLFVPEIDQKKAYFSSNRNCERNKIEVYSVEYSTINSTIQLIKGDFHDLLDEKNKMAQIKVINVNTSEEFGPFTTDENGKYSLLIPGSGDYKFSVTVDGSRETFIGTATVPVAKNNNVLKQTLTYSVVESDEHMEFANYFNLSELASEDDKIIVLNAIASLKMNPTLIQNKVIIPTETMDTKAVLAELGYDKLNQKDALTKMNDDLISVELQEEELSIDLTKAVLLQKENISYLSTLDNLIKEVKNEVNDPTISPNDKLVLLEKLKDLQEDKIELQQQIIALNQLIEQKESALEANRKLE